MFRIKTDIRQYKCESREKVEKLIRNWVIRPSDLIYNREQKEWAPIGEHPAFVQLFVLLDEQEKAEPDTVVTRDHPLKNGPNGQNAPVEIGDAGSDEVTNIAERPDFDDEDSGELEIRETDVFDQSEIAGHATEETPAPPEAPEGVEEPVNDEITVMTEKTLDMLRVEDAGDAGDAEEADAGPTVETPEPPEGVEPPAPSEEVTELVEQPEEEDDEGADESTDLDEDGDAEPTVLVEGPLGEEDEETTDVRERPESDEDAEDDEETTDVRERPEDSEDGEDAEDAEDHEDDEDHEDEETTDVRERPDDDSDGDEETVPDDLKKTVEDQAAVPPAGILKKAPDDGDDDAESGAETETDKKKVGRHDLPEEFFATNEISSPIDRGELEPIDELGEISSAVEDGDQEKRARWNIQLEESSREAGDWDAEDFRPTDEIDEDDMSARLAEGEEELRDTDEMGEEESPGLDEDSAVDETPIAEDREWQDEFDEPEEIEEIEEVEDLEALPADFVSDGYKLPLPIEVKPSQLDIRLGLKRSTARKSRKDAVYPLPKPKTHYEVQSRNFDLEPPPPKDRTFVVLVAVIGVIVLSVLGISMC